MFSRDSLEQIHFQIHSFFCRILNSTVQMKQQCFWILTFLILVSIWWSEQQKMVLTFLPRILILWNHRIAILSKLMLEFECHISVFENRGFYQVSLHSIHCVSMASLSVMIYAFYKKKFNSNSTCAVSTILKGCKAKESGIFTSCKCYIRMQPNWSLELENFKILRALCIDVYQE